MSDLGCLDQEEYGRYDLSMWRRYKDGRERYFRNLNYKTNDYKKVKKMAKLLDSIFSRDYAFRISDMLD